MNQFYLHAAIKEDMRTRRSFRNKNEIPKKELTPKAKELLTKFRNNKIWKDL